jgi:hypothetical protein
MARAMQPPSEPEKSAKLMPSLVQPVGSPIAKKATHPLGKVPLRGPSSSTPKTKVGDQFALPALGLSLTSVTLYADFTSAAPYAFFTCCTAYLLTPHSTSASITPVLRLVE